MARIHFLVLLILLPLLIKGSDWQIDQPHRYLIVNGEYTQLPFEDIGTESASILSSLNPLTAFQNFWSSLPSLNPFKSGDEDMASNDSFQDHSVVGSDQKEESTPDVMSNFFADPVTSFGGLGQVASGGFLRRSSSDKRPFHRIHKRSLKQSSNRMGSPKPSPSGPVKYLYQSLGQGSFFRYEIPIQTPEEIAAAQHYKKQLEATRIHSQGFPPHHPVFHPQTHLTYNPKLKPQYVKPFYHDEVHDEQTQTNLSQQKYPGNLRENSESTPKETEDSFPCPNLGLWKYDGELCTATEAIPPWSCKPIDLAQSGKLVICRNKVYY